MNARTLSMRLPMILAVGAIGLAFTVRMSAQVQTSTDTDTTGHNKAVSVEKGTVTAVSGNDLYVTMADGSTSPFSQRAGKRKGEC